jgi:hypothetical protein
MTRVRPVMQDMTSQGPTEEQRRRSIRRTTILLVLIAVAIYVGFIASSVVKA